MGEPDRMTYHDAIARMLLLETHMARIAEALGMAGASPEIVAQAVVSLKETAVIKARHGQKNTFYHITPRANLESILADGIRARIGNRAARAGIGTAHVHVYNSILSVEEAFAGWFLDAFKDADDLVVIAIETSREAEYLSIDESRLPHVGFSEIDGVLDDTLCSLHAGEVPFVDADGKTPLVHAVLYLKAHGLYVDHGASSIRCDGWDCSTSVQVTDGRVRVADMLDVRDIQIRNMSMNDDRD